MGRCMGRQSAEGGGSGDGFCHQRCGPTLRRLRKKDRTEYRKEILLPPGAGGRLHFGVVPRDFLEHAKHQAEHRQLGTELMCRLHGLPDTRQLP